MKNSTQKGTTNFIGAPNFSQQGQLCAKCLRYFDLGVKSLPVSDLLFLLKLLNSQRHEEPS